MKRFEIIEDDEWDYVVKVSAAEDARIKREIKAVYEVLDSTATKLIADGTFKGFGFGREIIDAITKSKNASEPYIVGRFDARYEPGKPIQFYELNTLYAGGFREKYEEELNVRQADLGRAEYVFENGLKSAWKRVARYMKERNIRNVGYLSVAPDVEDAGFLNAQAKSIIKFSAPKQKIDIVPADCPPDDFFGIRTYLNNRSDNRLLLPAACNMLLDNKAIWTYAYQFYPGHPNLIPTSFNPMDFIDSQGPLHEHWQKDRRIVAKSVYECQGKGQILIESAKQALKQKRRRTPLTYSAWTPEWVNDEGIRIELHGYILDGGRSAAYTFGKIYKISEDLYYDTMPHYIEVNPAQRKRDTGATLKAA